jgi:hypothetical protein
MIYKIKSILEKLLSSVLLSIFGMRAEGELIQEPTFHTTQPTDVPDFCEWCNEFRVSILHGRQAVYF